MWWSVLLAAFVLLALETAAVAVVVRRKHLDKWLASHFLGMELCPRLNEPEARLALVRPRGDGGVLPQPPRPLEGERPSSVRSGMVDGQVAGHQTPHERFQHDEPLHVFIAVCDHYEPDNARPARHVADARVDRWCREYPDRFRCFEDTRGRAPQHTFFYPQDEYFEPKYLDQLRDLCEQGFGDVDIHLHHDNDTADGLREKLETFRDTLHHRHGLLRQDPVTGDVVYGFIHGNWALCNSRDDGRWCGVNDELTILRETGCYADFTMPSAPEATQTRIINSIYYAGSDPSRNKSHDRGTRAALGAEPPRNQLLLMQGPLTLDWQTSCRPLLPSLRIENGDLLWRRAPSWQRFEQWLRCGVQVAGRPDWCFIKLHTHGCKDGNIDTLLGDETSRFHQDLRAYAARHLNFHYYYVTAWEMAQLAHQAEQGVAVPQFEAALAGVR